MPSRLSPAARWLLRGLVLLLVPVVVLSTPNVANAATKVSGTIRAEFGFEGFPSQFNWASCSFQAFYGVQDTPESSTGDDRYLQTIKVNSGNCDTGTGVDLGASTGIHDAAIIGLTFNGTEPSGAACSTSVSGVFDSNDEETFGPLAASITGLVPHTVDQLCTVAEFCWTIDQEGWLPGSTTTNEGGCSPLPMGPPALPSGTALAGCDFNYSDAATDVIKISRVTWRYYDSVWGLIGVPQVHLMQPAPRRFSLGLVIRHSETVWVGAPVTFAEGAEVAEVDGVWGPPPPTAGVQISGIKQYSDGSPMGSWGGSQQWYGPEYDAKSRDAVAPVGLHGVTFPNECLWYFGPKMYDDPFSVDDDPFGPAFDGLPPSEGDNDPDPEPDTTGPVQPPVSDEDEGCTEGFTIWNPLSWASAGFCEVVSALSSVLKALGGIPAAILKGLRGLFVPPKGYLNGEVSALRKDFEDTTPGAYLESVSGLVPGSVSGCGGLSLDVPLPGVQVDTLQVGAACSGFMANVAALVRLAISAVVVVGGGLACLRALGSGLGWAPAVGRGGGAA